MKKMLLISALFVVLTASAVPHVYYQAAPDSLELKPINWAGNLADINTKNAVEQPVEKKESTPSVTATASVSVSATAVASVCNIMTVRTTYVKPGELYKEQLLLHCPGGVKSFKQTPTFLRVNDKNTPQAIHVTYAPTANKDIFKLTVTAPTTKDLKWSECTFAFSVNGYPIRLTSYLAPMTETVPAK